EWNPDKYNGTPGAIVLGSDEMRERLRDGSQDVKTLMRSLWLMRKGGIQSYRRFLADDVAKKIYESKASRTETDSAWLWLKEQAFLGIDEERGVVTPTHPVYLGEDFSPVFRLLEVEGDIGSLLTLVSESGVSDDIFSMAVRCGERKEYEKACDGFKRYLE